MNYFVTAIDTDSGKTMVSAILCEALQADYWKPVQAGLPRDADTVQKLVGNNTIIFPEAYVLKTPASPHAAAALDGITMKLSGFIVPPTKNDLVIEGAGGCLVPLNDTDFVIDLAAKVADVVILVADLYLGSINHTLLTVEALRKRNLRVKGIIFNGQPNRESERIILHHSGLRCLLRIAREETIDQNTVKRYADLLKENWNE
ncbi:dethiobiotin synthase [Ohtaekwangia koreensis]|uniref:ATP-dependent dethiobiotin synthetase BioD n=1 Tax=Ohtaekwangia koreensis TaxID=688867 RepID=A0A1T5MJT6_9BACT|nr:dethiobiotin synthase [Ohtaekwangia koreensis]SKC88333.1 dethiobiotin synthetase [Ohtaekwangia koreensis]